MPDAFVSSQTFAVHVFGPLACFTRPELKVERVSYELITPSAARGILEAILWKPAICWVIERIEVHAPIVFTQFKRNEVAARAAKPSSQQLAGEQAFALRAIEEHRQQRNTMALRDVDYVIQAHFRMTKRAGADDNPAKFAAMFSRRLAKGQCFHRPYLGCREFACDFAPVHTPRTPLPINKPLGLMLHDIEFGKKNKAHFFPAKLEAGVLHVPPFPADDSEPENKA